MKMLIGGKWVDASDGGVINVVNPATGKVIDTVPAATNEDVEQAIKNAVKGQVEWNSYPLYRKLEILERYAVLLTDNTERIASIMCEEGGKPIEQCRVEVAANAAIFRIYISAANTFYGHTLPYNAEPRSQGDVAFTIHEPLGVFACIVPFNYPFELAAHKTAPMLVTGNSVILKPASETPRSALILCELLLEAGVPANAIQCLTGSGSKIGSILASDERISAVSFTGSTEVGVELAKNCAPSLKHVSLELGGNDPLIIFDDCDFELALSETISGRIGNAGQTCCASKRFIVQRGIVDRFKEELVNGLAKLKIGDPSDPSVDMGPVVSEKAAIQVEQQIQHTIEQGGKLLCGGTRNGAFVAPTVIEATPEMDISRDMEVFGPVFPIIPFDTMEEAIQIANNSIYGLSSGVITENIRTAMQVANSVQAGACIINGSGNYRLAHQPFGGYKMSGVGREGAVSTLEEMTRQKTISFKGVLK
ncbi:MAG: aldehyde dehydrogenase family protein [Eubacteriales bacterium]|jgi:acyl-CoA reductase-like NAD-dependent aldehyde dehydrogenase